VPDPDKRKRFVARLMKLIVSVLIGRSTMREVKDGAKMVAVCLDNKSADFRFRAGPDDAKMTTFCRET